MKYKHIVWAFCALLFIALCALPAIVPAVATWASTSQGDEPITQPSGLAAFQPDSVFKVIEFETFTGNGLVRAVVERSDGHKFSTLLIRKPGPSLGDRVVQKGDTVRLAEITYIRNAPPSGHGPIERVLVIQL